MFNALRLHHLKTYVAYAILFVLLAGDAVRYSIGWIGWGVLVITLFGLAMWQFWRYQPLATIKRVPVFIWVFIGLGLLSTTWSAYQPFTWLGVLITVLTTLTAFFFVSRFTWRELLRLAANTIRVILLASLGLEAFAAFVVKGPIAPLFPNFSGDVPIAGAYYWVENHLLTGQRIQGIVGNANLLGYIAMLGIISFAIEWIIRSIPNRVGGRWVSGLSAFLAVVILYLSRSASITFAIIGVVATAVVAILAEGRERDSRHRLYRVSWLGLFLAAFFVMQYREAIFDFLGKGPDASGRGRIWYQVFRLIGHRPLEGWGWIGYWVPGAHPLDKLVKVGGIQIYSAHNAYFDVMMQLGVIGFLIFGLMLGFGFVRIWRLAVRHTSPLYLWPLLVFVGTLVQNLTESRMLVENGWLLTILFLVKSREPEEYLEPRISQPRLIDLVERRVADMRKLPMLRVLRRR